MKNNYIVEINGKSVPLAEFNKNVILPEVINSLKLNFETEDPNGMNTIAILIMLEVLISKIKNKTEYTILLENLLNCMLLIKKLEIDVGLGTETY